MDETTTKTIQLIQEPIIKHNLEKLGEKVTARINELNIEKQVATEETIKTLKNLRAELNKESKEFEDQRKAVKDAVMSPYTEFELIYKSEIIEKYKEADNLLKEKINSFEMTVKTDKKNRLESYFNELCAVNNIDWLKFASLGIEVSLSTSEKKYKEDISAKIQNIVTDLELINGDQYATEIIVEYKKDLNVARAIKTVRDRKEAEKLEAERIRSQRTNSRTAELRSLSFVYHDITRTYNHSRNSDIYIKHSDVESLSDEDWMKKFAELKEQTTEKSEVKKTPLQSPVETKITEKKKEELFEAKFIVVDTKDRLMQLSEFLKSNNYKYKNID